MKPLRGKFLLESPLAGKTGFLRRFGTGIEQGMIREANSLLRRLVAKMAIFVTLDPWFDSQAV